MPPKLGYKQSAEHIARKAASRRALPSKASVFICPYCGTSKEMPPSRALKNRTCGADDCRARYRAEVGHGNRGKIRSSETRAKISATTRGRGHSPEHIAARTTARVQAGWWKDPEATADRISAANAGQKRPTLIGAGNPMWRGGVSKLPQGHRGSSEYAIWRLAVLDRDGWCCQVCGTDRNVIAHHILSWHFHKRYRTDINNGISLCRSCHTKAHGFVQHLRHS